MEHSFWHEGHKYTQFFVCIFVIYVFSVAQIQLVICVYIYNLHIFICLQQMSHLFEIIMQYAVQYISCVRGINGTPLPTLG